MNPPVVTVLIANHNNGKYLNGCIDSVLKQDYHGPIIVAIIDNGSTDDSWDIIERKCLKGNPKETIEEDGLLVVEASTSTNFSFLCIKTDLALGPSEARNVAIKRTIDKSFSYVTLDADDEMYPNKISRMLSVFKNDPIRIGAVYADYDTLDTSNDKLIREYKEPFSRNRLLQECIVHSGSMVSAQAFMDTEEETGYYDKTMRVCEDYDLWMRISERFLILHIPESLTLVRVTGENSSSTVQKDIWEQNWRRVAEKTAQRQYAKV
jgi:glycosyltransferase involved in cell wall biosynthesis